MTKHQRYFPLNQGLEPTSTSPPNLAPTFLFVANAPVATSTTTRGNEAVLRARFADAEFFYNSDLSVPLESFVPKLGSMTF